MNLTYEIIVPAVADSTPDGWSKPAARGEARWSGEGQWRDTAHDFGRYILRNWEDGPGLEEPFSGQSAYVEVVEEDGIILAVAKSAPVPDVVAALERFAENLARLEVAAAHMANELHDQMRYVKRDKLMSSNAIAASVAPVMSRPTALKILRGL